HQSSIGRTAGQKLAFDLLILQEELFNLTVHSAQVFARICSAGDAEPIFRARIQQTPQFKRSFVTLWIGIPGYVNMPLLQHFKKSPGPGSLENLKSCLQIAYLNKETHKLPIVANVFGTIAGANLSEISQLKRTIFHRTQRLAIERLCFIIAVL